MTEPVRIAMWSGPRSLSTAMMRSFEHRADCSVVDEPLYAAYLVATELEWRPSNHPQSGVGTRDKSLCRRFLVPGRPIDLPREEQPADALGLEPTIQIRRLDEVVFDGVARTQHHRLFEPRKRSHDFLLDLRRKTH